MAVVGIVGGSAWGNSQSISNALDKLGCNHLLVRKSSDFRKCSHLILAGVGSFSVAINYLEENGFDDRIKECVTDGVGVLGICLGMHLLYESGREGSDDGSSRSGLSLIGGSVASFQREDMRSKQGKTSKVLNVGWAEIIVEGHRPREDAIDVISGQRFYFMHGFRVRPTCSASVKATSEFCGSIFPAVVQRDCVVGCQFHPERSGVSGLRFLSSFLEKF